MNGRRLIRRIGYLYQAFKLGLKMYVLIGILKILGFRKEKFSEKEIFYIKSDGSDIEDVYSWADLGLKFRKKVVYFEIINHFLPSPKILKLINFFMGKHIKYIEFKPYYTNKFWYSNLNTLISDIEKDWKEHEEMTKSYLSSKL